MHRSENTILIWVLSWASLLLALLYSPIGSPDLYRHRNYFNENQGVNFNGSGISRGSRDISFLKVLKNAPRSVRGNQNQDAELNVPTANNNPGKGYTYQVTGSSKSFSQTKAVITIANNHFTSANRINEGIGSSSNSGGGGGGGMSSGITSNSVSRKSSQSDSGIQSGGVSSMSVDLSVFGDSTVNQINKNTQKVDSLVDPGDPALDQPIPVPEGWSFLILSGLVYCGYIQLIKKRIGNKVSR